MGNKQQIHTTMYQDGSSPIPDLVKFRIKIGINLGDIIQEEERIYGDDVHIAARLEGLANPEGICISKTAFYQHSILIYSA